MGLFTGNIGLFKGNIGLFKGNIGFFGGSIRLFCDLPGGRSTPNKSKKGSFADIQGFLAKV